MSDFIPIFQALVVHHMKDDNVVRVIIDLTAKPEDAERLLGNFNLTQEAGSRYLPKDYKQILDEDPWFGMKVRS